MAGHRPDLFQPLSVPRDDLPVEAGGEEGAAEVRQDLHAERVVPERRPKLPRRNLAGLNFSSVLFSAVRRSRG